LRRILILLSRIQIGLVQHLVAQAHDELIAFLADFHGFGSEGGLADDL
jgi:hypothetical protein